MTDTAPLLDLLACPRCDRAPLDASEAGWSCAGCKVLFPLIGGVPWLFAEPVAALEEWRGRTRFALERIEHEQRQLDAALATPNLRASTVARLTALKGANADHAARLRELLAPLVGEGFQGTYETYLALRTRLPPDQGLMTYYGNVHRDWAWGDAENEASFAIVTRLLGDAPRGRTLVLGAGAGRLAYDLHVRGRADVTVALDFNPLLVLIAHRVARGETVELYEFPIAPRTAADQAVLRRLAAPAPARPGLVFVLADAHRPPFRRGAFDTVVTPWLVDILPEPFDILCARINALLADGGRWLNFGSLSFHSPDPALRYGLGECLDALVENGLGHPEIAEEEIPYLSSPASRHGRRERVVSWVAAKERPVKKVPRHVALPDWLVRGDEPVPLTDAFRTQAAATRIYAYLMSLIDGRRSIKDMARLMEEQRLMTRAEAEGAIRQFFIRMYDDSRRGVHY
ncbi:MAG TPA: hypothetical protein VIN61_08335 [Gammaproteobacteria bacterium]